MASFDCLTTISGAKLGAAARKRAEAEFGTRRLIADHEALYERLMAELGAASRETDGG